MKNLNLLEACSIVENDKLIAKVEKLNVSDDSLVNLRNDNANLIAKIDKLNASLSSLKIENEKLIAKAKDLNVCNISISNLRDENENDKLIAKVEKLNVSDDSLVNLRNDNANLIAKIDKLNASLSSLKIENEKLIAKAKDLNVCNISISNLRDENDILHAKIVELNSCKPSTSTVEHVTICTRCRDINVDAIHDHLALIKKQNDHIAQLNAKINEHDLENENFKFARSMLYSGRRPGIKDDIGFKKKGNVKINALPKRLSNFVKGKAPMPQDNEGYIFSIVGDALASRMTLASKRRAMSKLMPFLKDCQTLLRARLPCLRITRVTFCTLPVILRAKLGELILGSLTLALIMQN